MWIKKLFIGDIYGKTTFFQVHGPGIEPYIGKTTYVSSSIKLASTGADSDTVALALPVFLVGGSGSSSGFGCINVNGNSATKSL